MPLPGPKFDGNTIWDGTTPSTRPNTDVFKRADGEIGNRHSSEIIALEETVKDILDAVEILVNLGDANAILGVKNDQSDLEYKTLVEGTGVNIAHAAGSITISASITTFSGIAGETLSLGDIVYIGIDGKAYKAQANAPATSAAVGLSDRNASIDDNILIQPIGDFVNNGWSLVVGDIYYLSPSVVGGVTNIPPTTAGQHVVPIGTAISSTRLAIDLRTRVKL
jgi:hypothetical protein